MLTLATLRALKGAPLSILIAMLIAKQPVGENWLCSITGYSQNTVRRGCKFLEETQMIRRNERYNGYVLAKGSIQLPLGMEEISKSALRGERHSPKGCSSSKSGLRPKMTLPSVTTTTAFNRNEKEINEENAVEVVERVSKNDTRLVLLYSAGVMEPTASRLLENDWVTQEYLEAHIEKANRENTPVGLLIHRIRSHDPKPEFADEWQKPGSYRKSWLGLKN
jgi:predicted transcriptional regulator